MPPHDHRITPWWFCATLAGYGLLIALVVAAPRLGNFRAEGVQYRAYEENFDDGHLPGPEQLMLVEGFSGCRWGLCLAARTSGRVVLNYPLPPDPQGVARLWFYAAPLPLSNRLAVSVDHGKSWTEVFRNRDLRGAVVDLSLPKAPAGALLLELGAANPSDHGALVLDRLELVVSNAPRPSDLPYLSALFRLAVLPASLGLALAPFVGTWRGLWLAAALPTGVAAATFVTPLGPTILGRGTWAGLGFACLLAVGHRVPAFRGHTSQPTPLPAVAAALVVASALALGWGEFLQVYRFPVRGDAGSYLAYMKAFAWGSPTHGFYSWGFGLREPFFIALGATFFELVGASDLALRLLTLLLSTLSVWLTYLAGRRLLDSTPAALLGAALMAGSPYLLFEAVRGLRTHLEIGLVLLLAMAAWSGSRRWPGIDALLAGGLAATLCLVRLPYLPGVVLLLAWSAWRAGTWRRTIAYVAVAGGFMALLVGPLLVAAGARRGDPFVVLHGNVRWFVLRAQERLNLEHGSVAGLTTTTGLPSEVGHVFRQEGGWVSAIGRGYLLAVRDVAVVGAQRYYWLALGGLALLLLTRRRALVGILLLAIAHVAPFYAVATKPIEESVAFPESTDAYYAFYGGGLFGYGIHDRYRPLAQGAPFAALAAGWLVATGFALLRRTVSSRQQNVTLPGMSEVGHARVDPPREPRQSDSAYRMFWSDVGGTFPSLKGAASTKYYFDCERLLHEQFFPELAGRRLLKTDLWDEAKNTEILRWAAEQGARPFGIDLAPDVVRQAGRVLEPHRPGFVVADLRALPFRGDAFDAIYSMGTIEHFPEHDVAVREMFRVLKPGGTAIIGVPNKLDPFLRPLLVTILNGLGAYPYGMERSFTSRGLRRLLETGGFTVVASSGILFMPGWLRMLDLLCHTSVPRLAWATGWLVEPFAWLYRRVPRLRRHGYLLASVVSKPVRPR